MLKIDLLLGRNNGNCVIQLFAYFRTHVKCKFYFKNTLRLGAFCVIKEAFKFDNFKLAEFCL